ncbi:MAG: tetratricopeptide repeat protein [Planctomycetota bacterium]|jgi:tetratricopeptide (TPR) repeat protein
MNASKAFAILLPVTLVIVLASSLFGQASDEIDRGVFKWLYSDETEQIYKKPISIEGLKKNPRAFLNLPVTLRVRFHRIEEGLFVPEFTPFSPEQYLNFSAWDSAARLWDEKKVVTDFPMMFVQKNTEAAQDLVRLNKFDVIEVFGAVTSLFEDKPWFEVKRIWLEKKSELTSTLFSHIRLAEDMFSKGMFELAVGEFDRILLYELSPELAGMLFKRKGESLLVLKKFAEAAVAFSRARSNRPEDAEVYKGWGTALMREGMYENALWTLERSLIFQAKQAPVYARMGYCRGKLADRMIKELSGQRDYLAVTKPADVRRREKQTRLEFDPGRRKVEAIRERITEAAFNEIVERFGLAILDCRKALFIDASYKAADDWKAAMEKRLAEFKGKYETAEEVKPAKKPSKRGKGK